MDPRRLEHFLAVAETLNFTRAAKNLHIAQPSLSQSIKTLERELRVSLFARLPSGLQLTNAGEALLSPASRALRALLDAGETVRGLVDVEFGNLDVVAPSSLITHPTTSLVRRFRSRYPGITLSIRESTDSAAAAEMVLDGRAEIAIFETTGTLPGLKVYPLFGYELCAVFPPGLESAKGEVPDRLAWSDLADHDLICLAPYTVSRRMIDEHGLGPNVVIEVHSIDAALELVRLGLGASVLIEPYAQMASEFGAKVARLVPAVVHPVGVARRSGETSPVVDAFLESVRTPKTARTSNRVPAVRVAESRSDLH